MLKYRFVTIAALLFSGAASAAGTSGVETFASATVAPFEAARSAPAQDARTAAQLALRQLARETSTRAGTVPTNFPLDVKDLGDLAQASLGYGFEVNDANPNTLLAGKGLKAAAVPTGTWRFAVVVDGRPVGLVTMAQDAAGWRMVSIGGAGLSADIDAVVKANPQAKYLRYVRVPQALADFVEVGSSKLDAGFVPLRGARDLLATDASTGHSARRVIEGRDAGLDARLRDAVARNLAE